MDTNEKVIETLKSAGKPMKAGEIAEASGVDKKEVDKAIKKLVAEGKIESPKRCFYDIKK
ncbi:helix-turn-helix domain-containing protein [Tenuifilum thalassicum]|uniref:GntR family transcriptional regulator n=1 Tax=Tenuifilum thalassicum TaxID=2590900 RepID=A0A7D3XFZ8_9BACT|nr:HTH domain-containing protein [Tenuifilum thalassicum]QKG79777.1 GntR family transcriptional regulator [Tenuifilum thalassicum]